jgi:phenylalanyl-tRNA synthetase alpha subunit
MEMNDEREDLPARITEMLARPRLTDLPENPVGAVWEIVKRTHDDHVELDLPETLTHEQIETIVGEEGMRHLPERVHRVDDRTWLRWDTSLPMLVAATGRAAGEKLIAAGKVYRDDPVDRRHLQVFHQAEALHVGEHVGEWDLMPRVTRWIDDVLGGARIRVEQVSFPMICSRAWEVSIEWDGAWTDILAWGRLRDGVVRALGHDPDRVCAVAVGMGLERIACLRYGIDDVRKVAATTLDEEG